MTRWIGAFWIGAVLAAGARADGSDPAPVPLRAEARAAPSTDDELQLEIALDARVLDGDGHPTGIVAGGVAARPDAAPGMSVALLALRSIAGSATFLGSGVGYQRTIGHAVLDARTLSGSTDLLLVPTVVTLPVALKLSMSSQVKAVLEPALSVGWVTGAVRRTSGAPVDFASSPGFGAQVAAGVDLHPAGRLGLMLRAGYRWLRPSLAIDAEVLASGGAERLSRPERLDADLSGLFLTGGVVVRL